MTQRLRRTSSAIVACALLLIAAAPTHAQTSDASRQEARQAFLAASQAAEEER